MSLTKWIVQAAGFALCALLVTPALAQSYGAALDLATAKKIAAGALAEAAKNNWKMAIAIVDNHGMLVYYERMDDTQTGSVAIALDKARTAYESTRRVAFQTLLSLRTAYEYAQRGQ